MLRARLSWIVVAVIVVASSAWLAVAPGESQSPRKGGVLRVGMIGEPPTLDGHTTTAVITREIAINMFEGLYALDAKYQPMPLLAEGHEVLDGGKRYAIRLRKDVKFHNGKPLTSADVVASLKRWGATASTGKATFKVVEAVEAKGPNAIEIRLKEPSGSLLTVLAQVDSAAVIYSKDAIDAAGDGQLKEFVGTGPFKFVEHKPDRHIKLARFDGYAARAEPPSGLAGRRTAYVDEILFMPVPDYATRQAGMVTGEYDYIQQVKPDQYDRMKSSPGVETVVVKPYGWVTIVFNTKQGLMTDQRLRQAAQAALDVEPMMLAGLGHKDFYRIDPGLFFQELPWHSRVGAASYNQRDKDKARRLLEGGRLHGPADALDRHHRVRAPLQAGGGRQEPARGGRLQDRPAGVGLGHGRAAAKQARAVGRVQHGLHVRAGADHLGPGAVRVARLVVQSREGRAAAGDGPRARLQEALRDVGEGADDVLRRGAAPQDRRLLPARRAPQGRARLRAGPLHALLERLARQALTARSDIPCEISS